MTGLDRSNTELSEQTLVLRWWLYAGETRPSDRCFGLGDTEVGWFVIGDILLAGLVTRVAQVLKVGDGSSMILLEYEPFLAIGGRDASIFNPCFDVLHLSHPLEDLFLMTGFGAGDPPSVMVFGGTFGGTSGALAGDTGERGTAVMGVLHSIGEKMGDNGRVGLKPAALSRMGVAHWVLAGLATSGQATPATMASPNAQSLQLPGTLLERSW